MMMMTYKAFKKNLWSQLSFLFVLGLLFAGISADRTCSGDTKPLYWVHVEVPAFDGPTKRWTIDDPAKLKAIEKYIADHREGWKRPPHIGYNMDYFAICEDIDGKISCIATCEDDPTLDRMLIGRCDRYWDSARAEYKWVTRAEYLRLISLLEIDKNLSF